MDSVLGVGPLQRHPLLQRGECGAAILCPMASLVVSVAEYLVSRIGVAAIFTDNRERI